MRVGTRWAVGGAIPRGLPEAVISAIHSIEDELESEDVDTDGWGWTLTWLEGKPVVELDDGTVITYDPSDDSASVS